MCTYILQNYRKQNQQKEQNSNLFNMCKATFSKRLLCESADQSKSLGLFMKAVILGMKKNSLVPEVQSVGALPLIIIIFNFYIAN